MKKYCIILCMLFLVGCIKQGEVIKTTNDEKVISTESEQESIVDNIVNNMTIEEKVGQLFIVDFYSFINKPEVTYLSEDLHNKINQYNIGGVIFFSDNIENEIQIKRFTKRLQEVTDIPLFISIDEEGGRKSRLSNNDNINMTKIPPNSIIGHTEEPKYAYEVGSILGKELNALGFNMDFAPVADINTNKNNEVIGDRAFGSNPYLVGEMVANEVKGIQEHNVIAVAKHFPGHGDTTLDSHHGTVYIDHNMERLRKVELIPFKKAINENALGIMVAHINIPKISREDVPASLSEDVIIDILRLQLGYEGLVITDAFNMKAITEIYNSSEAAIKAINAGVDIILMPKDFYMAYDGVIKAVKNGEISEDRINKSVKRILETKYKIGLFDDDRIQYSTDVLGSIEHESIIFEINENN